MENCWHTEDSEEENGAGNCKTSGDQITCDVQTGVSPPNSPTQLPTYESKGLPNPIKAKQVDPGSQFKITGCFSWKKGKRLQSTKSGLNSKYVSRDGNELSSSSSKTSFASVLLTPRSEDEILPSSKLRSFRFSDLKTAKRNFRPGRMLGKGGSGSVFEGWIDENTFTATKRGTGIAVAVKTLNQEPLLGHREWLAKVNYLGQLYHPNLVKFIGYCAEDEHRLLVTEFMPHGNLGYHLFRRGSGVQPLSWNQRMKVALGAAKGLAFLSSAETQVIYRDFKTSNILLDTAYNTKLSDSGLAKDGLTWASFAYELAPEYIATGRLTARTNTYSFGVVFLEMLSGRKAVDENLPAGEHNLIEWAKPYLSNKCWVLRIIDTRLEGQYTQAEALKATNLAKQCLSVDSKCRPTMEEVLASLEGLQDSNGHARTYHSDRNPNRNHRTHTNRGRHHHKRSTDEASTTLNVDSYPWPSPNPFYAH